MSWSSPPEPVESVMDSPIPTVHFNWFASLTLPIEINLLLEVDHIGNQRTRQQIGSEHRERHGHGERSKQKLGSACQKENRNKHNTD